MSKLIAYILLGLLMTSLGVNVYQYYFPRIEKVPENVIYLPGEKENTIVYKNPDGSQSATVKNVPDYAQKTQNAHELLKSVKGIPDLGDKDKITSLIAANMKLELSLNESQMVANDKDKQVKQWQDKYNTVTVDNLNNTSKVVSEVSPKIATTEKREHLFAPKESYTTITSENTSVKFYGTEAYTFKNPKQKDFVELNLTVQGLYLNKTIIPYGGAELLFNPDGKLKPVVGYGYFYDHNSGKLDPYWMGGLQFNLIRF